MSSARTTSLTLTACATALSLAACGGSNGSSGPLATSGGDISTTTGEGSTGRGTGGAHEQLVVGSANFPESQLLGAIYAAALQARGVRVAQEPNIGSREIYLKAIQDGSIDVIPEYTGNLALYDKNADIDNSQSVYQQLKTLIPSRVEVLKPSAAQDNDSITVTAATAQQLHPKTIADL